LGDALYPSPYDARTEAGKHRLRTHHHPEGSGKPFTSYHSPTHPAMESSDDSSDEQNSSRTKRVSWGNLTIFVMPNLLGDNPAVSEGAPLTIGWKYESKTILAIDYYEYLRQSRPRRRRRELVVPGANRDAVYVSRLARFWTDGLTFVPACCSLECSSAVSSFRLFRVTYCFADCWAWDILCTNWSKRRRKCEKYEKVDRLT
jgi:hypothetical protein